MSKAFGFRVGDKVKVLTSTPGPKEGVVVAIANQPGVYHVQIPGWGIFAHYGVNLEPIETVTLAQAWDEGHTAGYREANKGPLEDFPQNPYREGAR